MVGGHSLGLNNCASIRHKVGPGQGTTPSSNVGFKLGWGGDQSRSLNECAFHIHSYTHKSLLFFLIQEKRCRKLLLSFSDKDLKRMSLHFAATINFENVDVSWINCEMVFVLGSSLGHLSIVTQASRGVVRNVTTTLLPTFLLLLDCTVMTSRV